MPTYGSPGIGASIRIERAARPSARLSARPSIRDSLMPGSTSSAYCVTTGPSWMRATFTPIPKCCSVSWIRLPLAVRSIWAALLAGASESRSSSGSSQTRSLDSRAASTASVSPTAARCCSSSDSSASTLTAATPVATAVPTAALPTASVTGPIGMAGCTRGSPPSVVGPVPSARCRRTISGGASSSSPPPKAVRTRSMRPTLAAVSSGATGIGSVRERRAA